LPPREVTTSVHAESPRTVDLRGALASVSTLRGLSHTREVKAERLDREAMVERLREKALAELPAEAITREARTLQLLGLAPPSFDYLRETFRLLETQLEGFYDPKSETMYIASDLAHAEADATVAHELVHALQDQHWDLRKRSDYQPGHSDETTALACVAEGDATSVTLDVLLGPARSAVDLPDDIVRETMTATNANGGLEPGVPRILQQSLAAPYVEGTALVNELRRQGGWPAVNQLWQRPPKSTEQVLHLDKWQSDEAPRRVAAPDASALGPGWSRDDDDTLGELGLALIFEQWLPRSSARTAAAGWGGDRTGFFQRGKSIAFAAHVEYDSAELALRAAELLAPAIAPAHGAAARYRTNTPATCAERNDLGPLAVSRRGRHLVLAAGPTTIDGDQWRSAATCKVTSAWASALARQAPLAAPSAR